jgi:hypothetical protein
MAIGDVIYNGSITNATCYSTPKDYPGDIIDAGSNGSGQVVIICNPSENICFTICTMASGVYPITYQNDVYVVSTNTLYKGNYFSITQTNSQTQFKLDQCLSTTQNYPPLIMLPCDGVHSFCGDFSGDVYQSGNSYVITCYPSSHSCVLVNIDDSSDDHCW